MSKAILFYYSYTGTTKKLAAEAAAREGAELVEIKDRNRPGTLKAYTAGIVAAARRKRWPIVPVPVKLAEYERVILYAPVWAGNLAPAANNVLDWLPPGKEVEVYAVSASSASDCRDAVEAQVTGKECRLALFEDIKVTKKSE